MKLEKCDAIFVSNTLAKGGAARVISVLAREFSQRGLRIGVAVFNDFDGEYLLPASVSKEYGPSGNGTVTKIKRIAWLRKIAKRNPKATIIAFEYFVNMQTIIACTGLPNRVVISERNDPARVGNNLAWLREHLYRHADMLVCQTEDAANYFSDKVKKCVILNPIKEGLPEPYEGERRHAVVTFCRLEKQKNLDMLIHAFADFVKDHSDYTLEIYGDGTEHDHLLALIQELGLSGKAFIFPGRSDVHEVVRDAAMFVLPSNYEGLSNSMLEAMAIGLPVICTDCPCGGARMVIRDGENGYLVPVNAVDSLRLAMDTLATSAELSQRLASRAVEVREELDCDSIVGEWSKTLDR